MYVLFAGGSSNHKVTTRKITSTASPPAKITQKRIYKEASPSPIPPSSPSRFIPKQLSGHHLHHSAAQIPDSKPKWSSTLNSIQHESQQSTSKTETNSITIYPDSLENHESHIKTIPLKLFSQIIFTV
jgi:hypothetical protein